MSNFNLNYFIKPSIRNFIIMLLIWYMGIIAYYYIGYSTMPLGKALGFYSKYSWPNFILFYTLTIWIIPVFFLRKKYKSALFINVFLLGIFIAVKYFNNIIQNPEMYSYYLSTSKGVIYQKSSYLKIISMEAIRGLEFISLAFTYRFLFDWLIIENFRKKIENEKLKSELSLLRHQLNPHFLFNTINDIYYLALIKSEKTAEAMLKLSDLLRYILYEKEEWVPLEKEINYLKEFIHLHKIRFPNNVVNFELKNADLIHNQVIPPMLLSTFVENAFKHGAPGTEESPIKIMIEISIGSLHYKVENAINKNIVKDKSSGIGILNLEKRLNLLFPNKHTLSYSSNDEHFEAELEIKLRHDKSNSGR